MGLRVLVCGGRDYKDYDKFNKFMFDFCEDRGLHEDEYKMPNGITIIHGAAKGADSLADQWAVVNWVPFEEYPADWEKYGRSAGHIRNQQMLDEGKPDVVIAFPGGRGTANMIERARKAGVEVIEVG